MGNVVIKGFMSCTLLEDPLRWKCSAEGIFETIRTQKKHVSPNYKAVKPSPKDLRSATVVQIHKNPRNVPFSGVSSSRAQTARAPHGCRVGLEGVCQISLILPPNPGSQTPVAVRIRRGRVRPNRICENPSWPSDVWHSSLFRIIDVIKSYS